MASENLWCFKRGMSYSKKSELLLFLQLFWAPLFLLSFWVSVIQMLTLLFYGPLRFCSLVFHLLPLLCSGSIISVLVFKFMDSFLYHIHSATQSIQWVFQMSVIIFFCSKTSILFSSYLLFPCWGSFIFCFKHGCNCSFYSSCSMTLLS